MENKYSVAPYLGKMIILNYECKKQLKINNIIKEVIYEKQITGMISGVYENQFFFIPNGGDSISLRYKQIIRIKLVKKYYQTMQ